MPRYKTKLTRKTEKRRNLLPFWLSLTGIGLVLVAVWALWNGSSRSQTEIEVSGAPSLKVDQEVINYGDVRLGQPVRTTVKVTNVGDQTLRFKEAPYIEVLEGC